MFIVAIKGEPKILRYFAGYSKKLTNTSVNTPKAKATMLYYYTMRRKSPNNPPSFENQAMPTTARLDKFAVLLSGVCVLHCLLAPLAFTLLPILSINAFWEDLLFHQLMLWLVLPTSTVALLIGCKQHRDWRILGSGLFGMLMLITVAVGGHETLSPLQEKLATSIAGIVLAISHVLNYRACQQLTCNDKNCSTKHHH